jgi:hypothetical protein
MYIIRAVKAQTVEYVDIGEFRSNKLAKETLTNIANDFEESLKTGDTIKRFMGIHQFVHTPKGMSPIIYFITTD